MKGFVFLAAAIGIWTGLLLTVSIPKNAGFSGWDIAALRFFGAGVTLSPFLATSKLRIRITSILGFLAVLGGLLFVVVFSMGLRGSDAITASLLMLNGIPIFTAIFSRVINQERPNLIRISGVVGSLFALMIFVYQWRMQSLPDQGALFLFCAAIVWSLYTSLLKKWKIEAEQAMIAVPIMSAIAYLPLYFLTNATALPNLVSHPAAAFFTAFYHGVLAMIVQTYFYTKALGQLSTFSVSLGMTFIPILAVSMEMLTSPSSHFSSLNLVAAFLPTLGLVVGVVISKFYPRKETKRCRIST